MSQDPHRRLASAAGCLVCSRLLWLPSSHLLPDQTPPQAGPLHLGRDAITSVPVSSYKLSRRMPQPGPEIGGRIVEVQDRTRESFQRLASAELPALYWLARRLVRDGAEDLVQEALLRAYRSYGTLRQDTAAGPWLKSILVNVFRDQLRRQARSPEELPVDQVEDFSLYQTLIEQDPLPSSDTLHHDYLRAFGKEDVREVLLRLPELYRAPLVLRYMDGFATKEIARLLDVPLGTVLARLHRGRKRFEQELWAYAQETGLLLKGTVQ
jgi:RNA polymerase sigma-70 factor (ECF subfamily)